MKESLKLILEATKAQLAKAKEDMQKPSGDLEPWDKSIARSTLLKHQSGKEAAKAIAIARKDSRNENLPKELKKVSVQGEIDTAKHNIAMGKKAKSWIQSDKKNQQGHKEKIERLTGQLQLNELSNELMKSAVRQAWNKHADAREQYGKDSPESKAATERFEKIRDKVSARFDKEQKAKEPINPNKPVSEYSPDEIMKYMRSKGLNVRASQSANVSDEYKKSPIKKDEDKENLDEMTVAGVGGGAPDATSQGPLVWHRKGAGVMKTSPFKKLKKKKLSEGFGGGFGGMAATNSGNSSQGYTDSMEKKIKYKLANKKQEEKK